MKQGMVKKDTKEASNNDAELIFSVDKKLITPLGARYIRFLILIFRFLSKFGYKRKPKDSKIQILQAEVIRLQFEAMGLRDEITKLRKENERLQAVLSGVNDEWKARIATLKKEYSEAQKRTEESRKNIQSAVKIIFDNEQKLIAIGEVVCGLLRKVWSTNGATLPENFEEIGRALMNYAGISGMVRGQTWPKALE